MNYFSKPLKSKLYSLSKGLAAAPFLLAPLASQAQEKPNVLFIIADDLNTRIGPYMELDRHTPNLNRLAEEGVQFTRTYCQYPVSGPSRASLMSGLYPETNGVLSNRKDIGSYRAITPQLSNHPSLAGYFREQGYFTARVSKIYHMGVPGGIEAGEVGSDDPDSWDYAYNVMGPETRTKGSLEHLSPGVTHSGGAFARMIIGNEQEVTQTDYLAASQAISILENRAGRAPDWKTNVTQKKEHAPLFLAVGFVRPHVPLIAPENCYEDYPDDKMKIPETAAGDNVPKRALANNNRRKWKMSREQQQKTLAGYMASVQFMDRQVGRLLDALDRLKLRENTIVIFVSDHGYNLGEHNCWSKVSLWEGSVRVPMIISHPKMKKKGTQFTGITELVDLYPTLADLCGLAGGRPERLHGQSLAESIMKGKNSSEKEYAYTVTYGGSAGTIRSQKWRYTRWSENAEAGREELYCHQSDPEEHVNLADDPKYSEQLQKLRAVYEKIRDQARKDKQNL
ncbi:MAG: sulfatase [Cytophagales bacterium]|nr:sulfatase [Cytophagales bacterium]